MQAIPEEQSFACFRSITSQLQSRVRKQDTNAMMREALNQHGIVRCLVPGPDPLFTTFHCLVVDGSATSSVSNHASVQYQIWNSHQGCVYTQPCSIEQGIVALSGMVDLFGFA